MSRTDPFKKKRRAASQTLLVLGEGLAEEIFLKYLRSLYGRDSGVFVKIRNGKGGSAIDIVNAAVNELGAFNRRVVILDNDKGQREMSFARINAKQKGIELLENTPCLEAVFLAILIDSQSLNGKNSAWCKSKFESDYLPKKKRTEIEEYRKVFPKTLLDAKRVNVPELDRFIALMECK